jgi:hypothetical protein
MTIKEKMNPNKTARIAGFLYLILMVCGIFSYMFVNSRLIVPGDTATTINNIMASESLYVSGIVSWLISQTVFILLVYVLYKLLKPVNKNHAFLMVMFVLVAVPISFINELNKFAALLLLSGADYLTAFDVGQLQALVPLFLDLHEYGIHINSMFFGLWLLPLGYLVFKSGYIPRILGILLMIGWLGYMLEFFTFFLFPDFNAAIEPVFTITGIGEFLLVLWLLIKGVNVEQWKKRALESA